ncbi:MAG: hypothetical protein ACRCY4_07715, partial [Brevinema sp.]
MKLFILLLLLTCCPQVATARKRPFPSLTKKPLDSVQKRYDKMSNMYITAEAEFADLFEAKKWYPFILVRNGLMERAFTNGKVHLPDMPLIFENEGKVLVYTNKKGGIKINDSEILLAPSELSNFIVGNPILKDEYYYYR